MRNSPCSHRAPEQIVHAVAHAKPSYGSQAAADGSRGSPKRERVSLYAGVEKLDLEQAIGDGIRLPDQLIEPLLASAGYRVIVPYLRGYGTTRFLSSEIVRNGQPSAVAADTIALMDALKIEKATIAGYDWGARTANIVAALWPERCKAMVSVSGYLIGSQEAGKMPLPPKAELEWWYQYYFATERGRAGYQKYTHDFAKLIWQLASPKWAFDDATFARSAAAFDNPDHVAVVVHNYRWRLDLAEGEPKYDDLERRLAQFPVIGVPTITLEGDANGAPHPEPSAYAKKFSGKYAHRTIQGGIGHNLPQEAPKAFAEAVVEVDSYAT